MHPLRKSKTVLMAAGIFPAVFLTVSCQSIDDWFDRNKPEPRSSLTGTAQGNTTSYSVDEASAFFCNRLIMRFSMYYNGKPFLLIKENDTMSKKVAMQLYRANVVDQWQSNAREKCFLYTKTYSGNTWHIEAIDPKNGQILLSLSLPLKKK